MVTHCSCNGLPFKESEDPPAARCEGGGGGFGVRLLALAKGGFGAAAKSLTDAALPGFEGGAGRASQRRKEMQIMKKSNVLEQVREGRKRRAGLVVELAALPGELEAAQRRAVELAETGDLGDPATVDALVRSQAVAAALPARQASRAAQLTEADSLLLKDCHDLVSSVLGPKARSCEELAKGKARRLLKGFFSGPTQLDMAILQSEIVLSVAAQVGEIKIDYQPAGGAGEYAERLLEACRKLEELEAELIKS